MTDFKHSKIENFSDHLGSCAQPIELLRFDDCWRSLIPNEPEIISKTDSSISWKDTFAGPDAYGHSPAKRIKPLDFDAWGDPNTHVSIHPIEFQGKVHITPIEFEGIQGQKIRFDLKDLRSDDHRMDQTIEVPIGFRIPCSQIPRAFGIREMYLEPEIIDQSVDSKGFPTEWYYLEGELFGQIKRSPMDDLGPGKWQWGQRIHCGAPMAIFQTDPKEPWIAISGEPDYGAAIRWRNDEVMVYTTLFLKPGGSAHWETCFWRQQETNPANVYLSATRPGGFYDQLNPPGIERKGPPEGPIAFININRPESHFEELRKVKPKMVILNYIYDHISCIANMYGTWETYEGFTWDEAKLKTLIRNIKAMGAKVGYYGTHLEQPTNHKVVQANDFVVDKWGRRFNAWEPDNWVVDAGHEDCAERLAKAEAEFAQYYELDCVFVDRLDHMSVNMNPDRIGCPGNERLETIPSVRLGMIHLCQKRLEWQRKLNPHLYIGLNNTTQWAGGVRYSDFNLLEGGMDLQPPIFFLNAPQGLYHKQHYNVLFCDVEGDVVDHGIIQGEEQLKGFDIKRKALFRDALADGVIPQPYEDEIFVDKNSQFYKGWNDRDLPEAKKWEFYADKTFYGGDSWRKDEDLIARAMEVANTYCFPVKKIWNTPKGFPSGLRFSARQGVQGGYYIGVRNESEDPVELIFAVDQIECSGRIEPGCVRAWYTQNKTDPLETIHF